MVKGQRPEGALENVISSICFYANLKGFPLSITKLMKLVYLVEVYHSQMTGEQFLKVPFYRYHYGAYSPGVGTALEALFSKEILAEKLVRTQKGNRASIPVPKIKKTMISLIESGWQAVEEVLQDWGKADLNTVVNYTKKTLPFLNTAVAEEIDFSRSDPISEYSKEKGISEREAATRDILGNESLVKSIQRADKELRKGCRLLTWNEVSGG